MSYHARHQYVLVQSSPEGAPVYYHGERVGITPTFIEVRRGRNETVEIGNTASRKSVPVPIAYRWDGSFWSNFAWLYFAPVGWIVDWSSGGAWNMKDPEIPNLPGQRSLPSKQTDRVAIAPPTAESADISDEGGMLWEDQLPKRMPGLKLVPYYESLPEFASKGYDFDTRPSRRTENEIYGRLHVSKVLESELKETDQGVELHGRVRNVFNNETGPEQVIKAAPVASGESAPWYERFKGLIQLVPNTVGIEYSVSDTELTTTDGYVYRSQPAYGASVWEQLAPYVSAIDLSRLTPPRRAGAGRFHFEFVPSVRTSYRRITFPGFTAIQENEFGYLNIGAGLGPEIGWQWGPNYIYLNWIPMFGWHRLEWVRDDVDHVSSLGALTTRSELGYLYFITDRFAGKIFLKNTTSPAQMWNSAIQDISPGGPAVESGSDVVSYAIEFSYTWEPRREVHKWIIDRD